MFSTDIYARDLVTNNQVIDADTTVRDVVEWFRSQSEHDYIAVFDGRTIIGLVGRDQLNAKLAGQYGFAIMADKSVTRTMIPHTLAVDGAASLLDVTRTLLEARSSGGDFYVDLIVHENGEFLGLLPIKHLLVSQMRQIVQQMQAMQKQADILAQRNRELAEATVRLGQESADFTAFVENTSIPMLVLHADGSYAKANQRYLRLTGYPEVRSALGLECAKLMRGGAATIEACQEAELGMRDPHMSHRLILLHADGREIPVEASVDRDRAGKHWVISVVRVVGDEDHQLQRALRERLQGRGRLANAFVERLVDRETDTDALMERLQHVLTLADQMESGMISLPGSGVTTSGAAYLQGELTTFNMVDLLQLFVQAVKTGQLLVDSELYGRGTVFLENGRFVHAESQVQPAGTLFKGREAIQSLLRFKEGRFQFVEGVPTPEHSIQGDPMGILMRCCSELDEETMTVA